MEEKKPVKFYNTRWFSVVVVVVVLLVAGALIADSYSSTQSEMQRTKSAADQLMQVTNGG